MSERFNMESDGYSGGHSGFETSIERKRTSLEPADFGLYGTYYGQESNSAPNRFVVGEDVLSPELKKNPDAQLDFFTESKRYIESQDPEYLAELEALVVQDPTPLSRETKAVVCIPVAGHQEGKNIFKTLENYTNQTLDKKSFEIDLFVNHPDQDWSGNKIVPDETLAEIERFKEVYPDVRVRVLYKAIPILDAKIGYVRKLLNDAVIFKALERGSAGGDVVMISNDADNKGVAPEYIENFVTKFEEHPEVDAMLGQLDWDPESYVKNPLVHVGTRLFQYLALEARHKKGKIESSGANFAFRGSIYSAVGGYTEEATLGEDVDLGWKIKNARLDSLTRKPAGGRLPIAYAGARVSRLYTSSRRAIAVMKLGLAPIEQWNKGFSAFDDSVRRFEFKESDKGPDFDNEQEKEGFIKSLETIINRTIASSGFTADNESIAKALGRLGVKFEVVDREAIKITDSSVLISGLKEYQKDGMDILKRKTEPVPAGK